MISRMFARLILALLLAVFAFPAVAPAACHDVPTSGAHAMAMDHRAAHPVPVRDQDAVPPHGCIGCIPPSTWIAAPVVASVLRGKVVLIERAGVLDIGAGSPPALPPPRGV